MVPKPCPQAVKDVSPTSRRKNLPKVRMFMGCIAF
jgi:hypothetical protein